MRSMYKTIYIVYDTEDISVDYMQIFDEKDLAESITQTLNETFNTNAYAMTTAKVLLTNKKGRPRKDDNILWQ